MGDLELKNRNFGRDIFPERVDDEVIIGGDSIGNMSGIFGGSSTSRLSVLIFVLSVSMFSSDIFVPSSSLLSNVG